MTFFCLTIFKKGIRIISRVIFGAKFYFIKSSLILLKLSVIFTRYLIQKMSKFEPNWRTFYKIRFSSEFWHFFLHQTLFFGLKIGLPLESLTFQTLCAFWTAEVLRSSTKNQPTIRPFQSTYFKNMHRITKNLHMFWIKCCIILRPDWNV